MQSITRWFYYLLIANPMVVRIVQGGSRRQRHLWVRMGYLGALTLLLFFGLVSGNALNSSATSLNDLAKAGASVFFVTAYGQVVLICLLAPLFMAGAISAEQSGETFEIMLTTPLSNLQIVMGSLLGRLFFLVTLLASGLPLYSILLIFGGIPVSSVFVSFGVAALSALMMGSVAVTLAVLRIGGRKAVFGFVIAVAAYLLLSYALDTLLLRSLTAIPNSTTWITPLHPLLVLEAAINPINYRPPRPDELQGYSDLAVFYRSNPMGAFSVLTSTLSIAMLLFSALRLRKLEPANWAILRRVKAMLHLPEAPEGDERHRAGREVWQNPIAWREANTRGRIMSVIVGRWAFLVISLAAACTLLWAYHTNRLSWSTPGGGKIAAHVVFHQVLTIMLLVEIAIITLVAIYMSASSVSREREDGTLDLVITTPITPKYYIWGKLRGLVSFLAVMLAAPVLTLGLVASYTVLGQLQHWPGVEMQYGLGGGSPSHRGPLIGIEAPLLMLLMLVPFVAGCVIIGMWRSLRSKSVVAAIIFTVLAIGLIAGVGGICGLSAAENIPFVGPIISAISPVSNVAMIVNPWTSIAGYIEDPTTGRISLIIAAMVTAGAYSALVWGMQQTMVQDFDQTVRKLSGAN